MRGLAFPSSAISDREPSYENGTPNNLEDIPIDPALSGPAIDPALIEKDTMASVAEIHLVDAPSPLSPVPQDQYAKTRQYSQGPQGDPFAPPLMQTYFPIQPAQVARPQKTHKRKRKPRREEECGFCQGNDERNKDGLPEQMASCDECGRSGHPSCMQLTEIGDVIRRYPWKCTECKNCEICQEKGDDDRILFCDFCDRGWHMDCVDPPIQEAPTGRWNCPRCPPVTVEEPMHPQPNVFATPLPDEPVRAPSVASSSRLSMQLDGVVSKGKGKATVVVVSSDDDSESEGEMDVEVVLATPGRTRGQPKKTGRPRGRPPKAATVLASGPIESPAPSKRMKLRGPSPTLPKVRLRLPAQKGRRRDRDEDDSPKGMFDDILSSEDRDTSKTSIRDTDKQMFERSRALAEAKLAPLPPPPSRASESPDQPLAGPSRPLRSTTLQQASPFVPLIDTSISPTPTTPPTNTIPSKPRVRTIRFGENDIQTWYDAPFPEEYATMPDGRLWICEFCLKYMKSKFGAVRHRLKCKARHPPGDEIYRDGNVSIFEVDGRKNKIYCQNLCLLSKMFLDHKSLFYDVEPFLFYVIAEVDEIGARFVGYFSKEKRSPKDYNVSCIMTLPVRQRQGWGNLLIDFSYLLSKKEDRLGSPEKPLSALGAIGYKKYWSLAVRKVLQTAPDKPKLEDISRDTSMTVEDVYNTLVDLDMISYRLPSPPPVRPSPGQSIKYPKGRKNGIARRHLQRTLTSDNKEQEVSRRPFVPPKHYEIAWDRAQVDEFLQAWEAKGYIKLRPEKLRWTPYVLSRNMKTESIDAADLPTLMTTEKSGWNGQESINGHSANSAGLESTRSISLDTEEDSAIISNIRRTRSMSKCSVKQSSQQEPPRRLLRGSSSQAVFTSSPSNVGNEAGSTLNDEGLLVGLASQELNSADDEATGESVVVTIPPHSSPRKRRRFESTPEPEEGPTPTTTTTTATVTAIFDEPLENELVPAGHRGRMNGRRERLPLPDPVPHPEEPNALNHEFSGDQVQRPEPIITMNGHSDIKSEDTGTPLTNSAGHLSAPSDDTVIGLEAIHKIGAVNNGEHDCEETEKEIKPEEEDCEKDADGESDDGEEA